MEIRVEIGEWIGGGGLECALSIQNPEIPRARAIEVRVIALDQAFSLFGRESDDCIVQMKRSGYLAPTELLVRNASLPRKHLPEQAVAEIAVHICSALWLRETPALDEFE